MSTGSGKELQDKAKCDFGEFKIFRFQSKLQMLFDLYNKVDQITLVSQKLCALDKMMRRQTKAIILWVVSW